MSETTTHTPAPGPPRLMDLTTFRDAGYLQEVNRQFFHPLGLCLAMVQEADGTVSGFAGVMDFRDDEEGCVFASPPDHAMAGTIQREFVTKGDVRRARFGWVIQPVGLVAEYDPGKIR